MNKNVSSQTKTFIAKRENLASCSVNSLICEYSGGPCGEGGKQFTNGINLSYNANVKLMLMNHSTQREN
jgi:hypothetical protein